MFIYVLNYKSKSDLFQNTNLKVDHKVDKKNSYSIHMINTKDVSQCKIGVTIGSNATMVASASGVGGMWKCILLDRQPKHKCIFITTFGARRNERL